MLNQKYLSPSFQMRIYLFSLEYFNIFWRKNVDTNVIFDLYPIVIILLYRRPYERNIYVSVNTGIKYFTGENVMTTENHDEFMKMAAKQITMKEYKKKYGDKWQEFYERDQKEKSEGGDEK